MNTKMNWLALVLATFSMTPVWAQTQDGPTTGMDRGSMGHGSMKAQGDAAPAKKDSMQGMGDGGMKSEGDAAPAEKDSMQGMGHGSMKSAPPATQTESMSGMTHATMGGGPSGANPGMAGMGDGDKQTQGGPAPADARDPHAYSGGYTLEKGPYAMAGTRQLRLADEHSFGSVLVDRLERVYGRDSNATSYEAQVWYGRDYDRLVIKAEGGRGQGQAAGGAHGTVVGARDCSVLGYPVGRALRQRRHRTRAQVAGTGGSRACALLVRSGCGRLRGRGRQNGAASGRGI